MIKVIFGMKTKMPMAALTPQRTRALYQRGGDQCRSTICLGENWHRAGVWMQDSGQGPDTQAQRDWRERSGAVHNDNDNDKDNEKDHHGALKCSTLLDAARPKNYSSLVKRQLCPMQRKSLGVLAFLIQPGLLIMHVGDLHVGLLWRREPRKVGYSWRNF